MPLVWKLMYDDFFILKKGFSPLFFETKDADDDFWKMDKAWPNAPIWQLMWIFYGTTIFWSVK